MTFLGPCNLSFPWQLYFDTYVFRQNFRIFLCIFHVLDYLSVCLLVVSSFWLILVVLEVLDESRNPRWRIKMAGAKK